MRTSPTRDLRCWPENAGRREGRRCDRTEAGPRCRGSRHSAVKELAQAALDAAIGDRSGYADVRVVETSSEALSVRGETVESLDGSDAVGLGVRVLHDGAWGYAATARMDREGAIKAARAAVDLARAGALVRRRPVELVPEPAHTAVWASPVSRDPFAVPLEEKLDLLLSATTAMERNPGVGIGRGSMDFVRQSTRLISTEGSDLHQTIVHSAAGIEAIAVGDQEIQQRSYPGSFRGDVMSAGYEFVVDMDLPGNAERTADEAVALLNAPECPSVKTTLVLDGHQVMLQVHESVGHATELDRVLGMEASFAGTSFLSPSSLGTFEFGSPVVNITSDPTAPGGVGTYAYDDEGVAARRVDLIREGVLVGFQTSRETAAVIGADRSNGTMRAEGWENIPLIRMANVNLLPGSGSLQDLLADVDRGIYMATNKSWSIDDKRKNFQFGCEAAWEIKNGRLSRLWKNPRYTGITPVFWASCDAVAGPEEWRLWGTPNCGKGQPGQVIKVGHGAAPARFRDVAVGVAQ
jgi:TldD protein